MNKSLYSILVILISSCTVVLHAQMTFEARLSGRGEVLPVLSQGSGEITAVLTDSTLVVTGSFKGLSTPVDTNIAGGSHIHRGFAGQNGPVMFPLTPTFGMDLTSGTYEAANNTFTLSAAQVQALMDRRFYVNIHTQNYPGGEIRGQLLMDADSYYLANLFGSNEVPPLISSGSGSLAFEVAGNTLVVTGSFQGLDGDFDASIGGGSHLHMGLPGANGGVIIPLNATVDPNLKSGIYEAANNTFTLDSAQMAALEARSIYANIHTSLWPSGELRGQVVSGETMALFRAHLSGSSEVPVVTSKANGVVLLEVIKDSLLEASGTFRSLGSPLAVNIGGGTHIHTAMAGRNGPVVFPLMATVDSGMVSGSFTRNSNSFSASTAQTEALFGRGMYVNIHSEDHPGGEIRGQLLPEGQSVFNAFLSSAHEVPENYSGGNGDVKIELNGNRLTVSGTVNDLGSPLDTNIAGGAHIHLGLAGQTGGIVFPLKVTLDSGDKGGVFQAEDNVFTIDSAQTEALKDRRYYVNVHSELQPSGEVRGQALHQATTYFMAPLSGASEPSLVNTTGRGMVAVEINGDRAYVSGSFAELTSAFNPNVAGGSHIHGALAGRNGSIVFPLSASTAPNNFSGTFEVDNNVLTISQGQLDTMIMRMNYVNIHTVQYPGGEIRGQLLPLATHYFTSTLRGINETAINNSGGHGELKLEITGNTLTVHGTFNDLDSPFDPNVAGGAHLHLAMPGTNGPITVPLNATPDAGGLSGVFLAANNTIQLDSAQIAALSEGNLYANIHTVAFPGGEIRGQVLKETNQFPAPETDIISPASGTALTIGGNPNTPFIAQWLSGFEPDANKQVYIWQLATDPDFTDIIFQTYTGTQNSFTSDYMTIEGLLAAEGLNVGDTDTFYHRALGSDGSLVNHGDSASIILTRGDFTQQQGVDLELSITANVTSYTQYVDVTYTVTITNTGSETATGVTVDAGLPTGMVHTFNTTDIGTYNLFFERWDVGTLAPGETGTLTLVLFPLINNTPITNYVQVTAQDQPDVDSAPNNGTPDTPNEDDEAVVTISGPTLPPMGGNDADLELFASVENNQYDIYVDVAYRLTLVNNGPDDAAGINVHAGLPAGMVHTSNSATHGQYNLFFERWEVGFLAAGDTAYLDLVLFPLVDNMDLTNFFEVLTSNQGDPDSTPGNGTAPTPNEDDEAVVTVMPSPFSNDPPQELIAAVASFGVAALYPNPASTSLNVQMISAEEKSNAILAITDQSGRLMGLHKTDVWKGVNQWTLDLSGFTSGLYFLRLPDGETLKFVKM